jgi:tetratricopeptide (TPR) repeat protein
VIRTGIGVLVLLSACGAGPSAEAVADLSAAAGSWPAAFEALQGAGSEPRILGKRAEAALQSGKLSAATRDWIRLASYDSTRRGEAAVGLVRTAVAAERQGDRQVLAEAVIGLRRLAPEWPVGRLALSLRMESGAPSAEAEVLAPAVLAAAPSRDVADDALYALGRAEQELGDCASAEQLLGVVFRRASPTLAGHASRALADCRLRAGLIALSAGDTVLALNALESAVEQDPLGPSGRSALVALGDVHLQMGDPFAAELAWQTVATAAVAPDSITALALERLRARPATDSVGVPWQP